MYGPRGRPQLVVEPGLLIGQVVKRPSGRRLVEVVRGSAAAVATVLARTGAGLGINAA